MAEYNSDHDEFDHALALQRHAALQGFDWEHAGQLVEKLQEEAAELLAAETPSDRLEELGDLVFMLVNIARHLDMDIKQALALTNAKFESRFAWIMRHSENLPPVNAPDRVQKMEDLWQQAKKIEKSKKNI